MSDTIWVSLITSTPILIVAFFNSYFQYKTNKNNSKELAKFDILKDFNTQASKYYSITLRGRVDYEKSLNNVLIYFSKANISFINQLEEARKLNDWNKYYPVLRKTIKYLSSLI